jgi:hypothetical protein
MKKVTQKHERPKAISQASLRRGWATKRRTLSSGFAGLSLAAWMAGLSDSLRYQNIASRQTVHTTLAACGAHGPYWV